MPTEVIPTADTAPPEEVSSFLGCALDDRPLISTPIGPAFPSTALATGTWLGQAQQMNLGIEIAAIDGGPTFVFAEGISLPAEGPATPRLYAFDEPPAGSVSSATAEGPWTWPVVPGPGQQIHAWRQGSEILVAMTASSLSSTVYVSNVVPEVPTDSEEAAYRTLLDTEPPLSYEVGALETGDINGDGVPDLAVGMGDIGATYSYAVVHTGPFGPGITDVRTDADYVFDMIDFELPNPPNGVGYSRIPVHDIDGDGADDILLASSEYAPDGVTAEQLYGLATWTPGGMVLWTGATTPGHYARGTETAVIEGTCGSLLVGLHHTIGRVGPDPSRTLVGAIGIAHESHGAPERGALYLMDLEGVTGTVNIADISPGVILGDNAFDTLDDFAPMGDMNGDGFEDFVLISRWAEGSLGAAYLFLGPVEGIRTASTADLILYGSGDDGLFGTTVESWDADGDGIQDLLVGDYLSSYGGLSTSGSVHYYSGASLLAALQ